MIRIYKNDCDDFNNNGLGILSDFKTSPKIKESLMVVLNYLLIMP